MSADGSSRRSLLWGVLLVSLLTLAPLVALAWDALFGGALQGVSLGSEGRLQVGNTLALVAGEVPPGD